MGLVASDPFGLSVLDVANAAAPSVVGSANRPFIGHRVAVAAHRAVVVGFGTDGLAHLWVLDITDVMHPVVQGELPSALAIFRGVTLDSSGNLAVVAAGTAGIVLVDLSNPLQPQLLGSYDTSGTAYGVVLNSAASMAYVADGTGGLKVLDITNRTQPTQVGSLGMTGTQVDIGLYGTIVVLVSNTGPMSTVDVSTPGAPVLKHSMSDSASAIRVSVDGSTVAVLSGDALNTYIDIWNISNPASPLRTSSGIVGLASSGAGMYLTNGFVYLAEYGDGVKIFDTGTVSRGGVQDTFVPKDIDAAANVAVVVGKDSTTTTGLLEVLNTTTSQPTAVGELVNTSVGTFTGVALNSTGTLGVVTMGAAGVWVVDFTVPRVLGSYDTSGMANAVALNSTATLAYIADGAAGLKVLDISNPAQPVLTGSLSLTGTQVDIALSGNIVCLVSNTGPLSTVDVSTPSAPVFKGAVASSAAAARVAVNGSTIAVLSGDNVNSYLDMRSISTSGAPTRLGSVIFGPFGSAMGVELVGNTAYLATNFGGLVLYDITAPATPTLRSVAPTVGAAVGVAVNGSHVYVADSPAIVDVFIAK